MASLQTLFDLLIFIALCIIVLHFLTKWKKFVEFLVAEKPGIKGQLIGIIVAGLLIMVASHITITVGARTNVRDCIAIFSAILAGPMVGITVGFIGGIYRTSLGGWTAIPCGLATICAGIIGAYLSHKGYKIRDMTLKQVGIITLITGIWEVIHIDVFVPLLGTKPVMEAFQLMTENILFPMTLINMLGIATLLLICRDSAIIRQSHEELQKAYEDLKELDKMKTQFVAIATHELGTPITVAKGNVELLLDGTYGKLSDTQLEKLDTVNKSIDRLARLNRELMILLQIGAGVLRLKKEPTPIGDLAKDVTKEMQLLADEKGHQILVNIPEDFPTINCDRERIRQVLTNLVSNAIKFISKNGKITVDARDEKDKVVIMVTDNGIGIPAEEQEKIFEPFYESGSYLKHKTGSTGLGLSITKGIVESHGGEMWVKSEVGKGSTFYFSLPKGA